VGHVIASRACGRCGYKHHYLVGIPLHAIAVDNSIPDVHFQMNYRLSNYTVRCRITEDVNKLPIV
jgi:hypothetical protein